MTIMLIAGHGGSPYDSGAVGCGYTEAVETRAMANLVQPLLQAYGFTVKMYDQSKDAYKVVTGGGSIPVSGVDYVLEFHLNAGVSDTSGNGKTTGSEIWVHTNESSVGVETAILANLKALGFTNRGVKRSSNLAVLKNVYKQGVSHALVETCFIDDADDMKLYGANKQKIAQAIADGVAEGFGISVEEDDEVVSTVKVYDVAAGKTRSVSAINKDNTNYIKLRDLEQFGCVVDYDSSEKLPTIDVAPLEDTTLVVNGESYDITAVLRGGNTNLIGVRSLLNILGVDNDDITWDGTTRTITVTSELNI